MANLVNEGGSGLNIGASVYTASSVVADVNAAVAAAGGLRLRGYSIQESAGTPAAAACRIMHGATVGGGTVAAFVKLAASGNTTVDFGPAGIACPNGISFDWVSGQVDVCIYYAVA
jgi:hypothetical protein